MLLYIWSIKKMAQDQTNAICKDTNKVDEQSTEFSEFTDDPAKNPSKQLPGPGMCNTTEVSVASRASCTAKWNGY